MLHNLFGLDRITQVVGTRPLQNVEIHCVLGRIVSSEHTAFSSAPLSLIDILPRALGLKVVAIVQVPSDSMHSQNAPKWRSATTTQ